MTGSTNDIDRIRVATKIWLFLDYDGTLAEFAPTPDEIIVDPLLIELLRELSSLSKFRLAVISGRRLDHVRTLIPIEGILLAGTYGIELLMPSGEVEYRLDFDSIRPYLNDILPIWQALMLLHKKLYLEDKGWSLAIHAKNLPADRASEVLNQARTTVNRAHLPEHLFQVLSGYKFLEIAPKLANKGTTLNYLLSKYPHPGSLPIYIGDDDKDEDALGAVIQHGGIGIKVSSTAIKTKASLRIQSPAAVRSFLATLL